MLHLNRSLLHLVQAYKNKDNQAERRQHLQQSLDEIHSAQQRLKKSEHAPFVDWYANGTKFGIGLIKQHVRSLHDKLTP